MLSKIRIYRCIPLSIYLSIYHLLKFCLGRLITLAWGFHQKQWALVSRPCKLKISAAWLCIVSKHRCGQFAVVGPNMHLCCELCTSSPCSLSASWLHRATLFALLLDMSLRVGDTVRSETGHTFSADFEHSKELLGEALSPAQHGDQPVERRKIMPKSETETIAGHLGGAKQFLGLTLSSCWERP